MDDLVDDATAYKREHRIAKAPRGAWSKTPSAPHPAAPTDATEEWQEYRLRLPRYH
jgi:hypothetical protein